MALLLDHLTSDPRQAVRLGVLGDLLLLAGPDTAHLWTKANVSCMVQFAGATPCSTSLARGLAVLSAILSAGGVWQCDLGPGSPLLALCETGAYSDHLEVAARGTELLTTLAIMSAREARLDLTGEAVLAIEALCFLVSSGGLGEGQEQSFRRCLRCVVQLCRERGEITDQFVDILGGMLGVLSSGDPAILQLLCETLAALGSLRPEVLALLVPDISHLAEELCRGPKALQHSQSVVLLCTLLLQTMQGRTWPPAALSCLQTAGEELPAWHKYRLARAASRWGNSDVICRLSTGLC